MINRKTTKREVPAKHVCALCGCLRRATDYFLSSTITISDKKYCKECLSKMVVTESGNFDLNGMLNALRLLDKPYVSDFWEIAADEVGGNYQRAFPIYMRKINVSRFRNAKFTFPENLGTPANSLPVSASVFSPMLVSPGDKDIDPRLVERWGAGYKANEYAAFEKKYNQLRNNYVEKTAMHTEALTNYIKYKVREELAIAKGDSGSAKAWGYVGILQEAV